MGAFAPLRGTNMLDNVQEHERELDRHDRRGSGATNDIILMNSPTNTTRTLDDSSTRSNPIYKVYKRRFFGLGQLVLLNIVVSWDVRKPMSLYTLFTARC